MEGPNFMFYCKPYLLRLHLPSEVTDEESNPAKAVYDVDDEHGTVTIHLPKKEVGLHFEGMDMLTSLLIQEPERRGKHAGGGGGGGGGGGNGNGDGAPPLIQEIDENGETKASTTQEGNKLEAAAACMSTSEMVRKGAEEENQILTPQMLLSGGLRGLVDSTAPTTTSTTTTSSALPTGGPPSYGFGNRYKSMFRDLRGELFDVVELTDPDGCTANERRVQRVYHEDENFQWKRYGEDACVMDDREDGVLNAAVDMVPFWMVETVAESESVKVVVEELVQEEEEEEEDKVGGETKISTSSASSASSAAGSAAGSTTGTTTPYFNEEENEAMRRLPRRTFTLSSDETKRELLSGLTDILVSCFFRRLFFRHFFFLFIYSCPHIGTNVFSFNLFFSSLGLRMTIE